MSSVIKGVGKVFKAIAPIALPILAVGATIFTGGAALPGLMGVLAGGGGIGASIAGGLGLTGTLGAIVSGGISSAVTGAITGGLGAAVSGGDFMDGVLNGAKGGAIMGGIGGGLGSALGPAAGGIKAADIAGGVKTGDLSKLGELPSSGLLEGGTAALQGGSGYSAAADTAMAGMEMEGPATFLGGSTAPATVGAGNYGPAAGGAPAAPATTGVAGTVPNQGTGLLDGLLDKETIGGAISGVGKVLSGDTEAARAREQNQGAMDRLREERNLISANYGGSGGLLEPVKTAPGTGRDPREAYAQPSATAKVEYYYDPQTRTIQKRAVAANA